MLERARYEVRACGEMVMRGVRGGIVMCGMGVTEPASHMACDFVVREATLGW
jgi:hypothetical protein